MQEYKNKPEDINRRKVYKKLQQKNLIILIEAILIIVLIISVVLMNVRIENLSLEVTNLNTVIQSGNNSSLNSSQTEVNQDNSKELNSWYLRLVNPDNHLTAAQISDVQDDLTEIDARFSDGKDSSKYFDKRAVESLNKMCQDALKDNISLICISSYRTYNYQNGLFNNRVNRFVNQGQSQADAKVSAAKVVAVPGSSEHHLGLAVDFNEVEEKFDKTAAFRWLQENAENYGFIMRYPKDKQDITKIIYEPWHYRYVGVEHAKAINSLDMCFEEYIEYLKNGK